MGKRSKEDQRKEIENKQDNVTGKDLKMSFEQVIELQKKNRAAHYTVLFY